jgi:putative chitinase
MILTAQQLSLATGARIDRAESRLESYLLMMGLYEINTRLRMACFLANVGHESGGFKYASEIWGDTAAQKRYEGRRDLGNVFPGDGRKFAGHGDMQITGRTNHAAARDRLRARFPDLQVPDFEAEPWKLAELPWAAFAAGDYWSRCNTNEYADVANFEACCDEVNRGKATLEPGDTNGFEHRLNLFVAGMRYLP